MASMVYRHLMLMAKTAEECTVLCDGMVQMPWYLNCLALLFFEKRQDVSLSILNSIARSFDFNIGVARSLPRNI
jgi:hypothetical protein